MIAIDFLDNLTKAVPYKIHTVLTDNGIQFAKREGAEAYWIIPFDRLCAALGIEHRLTKVNHPWTNGQVERMNRTIKEATVKRYYYQSQSAHVPDGLPLRQTSQKGPEPLRIHLQNLDNTAQTLHYKSVPAQRGTKHLVTADLGLYLAAAGRGLNVVNFNHLRESKST